MSLKTSFCKGSIIKSDFKRLWWIPALHTLLTFLFSTLTIITDFYNNSLHYIGRDENILHWFYDDFYALALIVPVILGVLLFSYMQTGKASTFAHSLPVSRGTQFVSHIVSGLIMILIPLVFNSAVLLVMRLDVDFAKLFTIMQLVKIMWEVILYSLVAFSGAVCVSFMMGNTIASIIFTYVFGVLPLVAELFINFFASTQLHGYAYDRNYSIMEFLYVEAGNVAKWSNSLLYLVISILLFGAGYGMYKLRNLENHSEIVAFPKLRPVFIYGAGICCGCVGFAYFNGIWGTENALLLIPFGILGIIIAQMIVKKSFKVPEVYKPILGYSAFILVIFVIFTFDLTGYEHRIPQLDDVEYVTFFQEGINDGRYSEYWARNGREYRPKYPYSPDIKDKETIEDVIWLHKCMTDIKDTKYDRNDIVYLTYHLTNGKTLKRQYNVNMVIHKDLLEPIVETDVIRQKYFPVLRNDEHTVQNMSIIDYRLKDPVFLELYENQEDKIDYILSALKKDLMEADYDVYAQRDSTAISIEMVVYRPGVYLDGTEVNEINLVGDNEIYYIRPSYKNTLAVLEELGLFDALPTAEDVVKINVTHLDDKGFRLSEEVIIGKEEIAQIVDYIDVFPSTNYDNTILDIYYKDGHNFSCYANSHADDAPECLK